MLHWVQVTEMSARVTSKIQYLKNKLVKKQENLLFWIVACTR